MPWAASAIQKGWFSEPAKPARMPADEAVPVGQSLAGLRPVQAAAVLGAPVVAVRRAQDPAAGGDGVLLLAGDQVGGGDHRGVHPHAGAAQALRMADPAAEQRAVVVAVGQLRGDAAVRLGPYLVEDRCQRTVRPPPERGQLVAADEEAEGHPVGQRVSDRRGGLRGLHERNRGHLPLRRGARIERPDFGVLQPHRHRPQRHVVQRARPAQQDPEQVRADLAPLDPPVGAFGDRDTDRPQDARAPQVGAEGNPLAESLPSALAAGDRDRTAVIHQCGDFELRVAVPQQLRHDLPILADRHVEPALQRQAAGLVCLQIAEAQPRRRAAVRELVRTSPREFPGGPVVGARLRRPVEDRAGRHRGGVGHDAPFGRPDALFVRAELDHGVALVDVPPGFIRGTGHGACHELRRPHARLPARQTDAPHCRPAVVRTARLHVVQPQPHRIVARPVHAEGGRPYTSPAGVQHFQQNALGGAAGRGTGRGAATETPSSPPPETTGRARRPPGPSEPLRCPGPKFLRAKPMRMSATAEPLPSTLLRAAATLMHGPSHPLGRPCRGTLRSASAGRSDRHSLRPV